MLCKILISNIEERDKYSANLNEKLEHFVATNEKNEFGANVVERWNYLADIMEKHKYSAKICIQKLGEKDLWILATGKRNNRGVWKPTAKWKTI